MGLNTHPRINANSATETKHKHLEQLLLSQQHYEDLSTAKKQQPIGKMNTKAIGSKIITRRNIAKEIHIYIYQGLFFICYYPAQPKGLKGAQ